MGWRENLFGVSLYTIVSCESSKHHITQDAGFPGLS